MRIIGRTVISRNREDKDIVGAAILFFLASFSMIMMTRSIRVNSITTDSCGKQAEIHLSGLVVAVDVKASDGEQIKKCRQNRSEFHKKTTHKTKLPIFS